MDKLSKLGKLAGKAEKMQKLMNTAQTHLQPFMGGSGQQHGASAPHSAAPRPPQYGQYGGGQGYAPHAPPSYSQSQPPHGGKVVLLTCIQCNSTLELPAEAKSVICGVCHHVFHVGYPPPQQQHHQQQHSQPYPAQPSRPTPSAPPAPQPAGYPPPAGYPQSRSVSETTPSGYPSW